MDTINNYKTRIMHELPNRLRVYCSILLNPNVDSAYLEAILSNLPGVTKVRINVKAATVVIHYDGDSKTREKILLYLNSVPQEVYQPDSDNGQDIDLLSVVSRCLLAGLTYKIPNQLKGILSWGMGIPVISEGVETFLTRGVKVETLDASAVGFSLLRKDYFTANAIVAMLSLGQYMEQLSEQKTDDLLKSLLNPPVEEVWIEKDGLEKRIPLNEVVIGDIIICGSGNMIPVDGKIITGEALVNQSSITGESVPVHVTPDDYVLSGSVIEEGRIKIKAQVVGPETSMARITRFLQNSLKNQSKSQKRSDELADKLVPLTFGLGIATYCFTKNVTRAASVLTVDYSCVIKLANPTAVKTAMYSAAKQGVLLKGSQSLDSLARVDTIVFDKTGTLTKGKLAVTDVISFTDMNKKNILSIAAGAEDYYSHPMADAVVAEAKKQGLELPETGQVDFIVAHGVSAYIDDKRVLVGSYHFLHDDENVDCSISDNIALELRKQGKTILFVAMDGRLIGLIALRDNLRPEADKVLLQLKEVGIKKIIVLTGDHEDTAKAIAGEIEAIDEIYWELKPEEKASIIEKLQKDGHTLAFAGDGVNDAPALMSADVGICMPSGADLAREAAQVVLMEDDLSLLTSAREIAVKTKKVIENSFKSAVGINSLILLLATMGKLNPVTSAFLHNASTLGIIGYAGLSDKRKQG